MMQSVNGKGKSVMSILAAICGSFGGLNASTIPQMNERGVTIRNGKPRKGQIRNAKSKASGAAQLKRAAKKRNNIRKRK